MERSDYWGALARGWWLIVIFGLAGLALGLVSPRHAITTSFSSTSAIGSPPSASTTGNDAASASANQILYYGGTDGVLAQAAKLAGLDWPTWLVRDAIQLQGPPASNAQSAGGTSGHAGVINVLVQAPTVNESLALNNAFDAALGNEMASVSKTSVASQELQTQAKLASIYGELALKHFPLGITPEALGIQVTALENHLAALVVGDNDQVTGYSILQTPVAAQVAKSTSGAAVNNRKLRGAAGLAIGMAIGALAAVALWLLDRRLKTAKRAQLAFGYPVVAEIPSEASDSTEHYRMLWLSVFREPLPLSPAEQNDRWYEGENPVLDATVGSPAETP